MKTDKLLTIMIAVVLLCLCGVAYGVALDTINEGFEFETEEVFVDIRATPCVSISTGIIVTPN
jgi:hypothetical protein